MKVTLTDREIVVMPNGFMPVVAMYFNDKLKVVGNVVGEQNILEFAKDVGKSSQVAIEGHAEEIRLFKLVAKGDYTALTVRH